MAEKLDEVKAPLGFENNILSWLQTELNNHGIPHSKQYGQYLIFLLSNHVYINRNKVMTEIKYKQCNQTKKPRRFLLSRQRSKSFNSPDDAAIRHLRHDQSTHPTDSNPINLDYFSTEAMHVLHHLGCLDKNYVTSLLNELVKRLTLLNNPSMKNPLNSPILPSCHVGLPLINPYLVNPASLSEQDLYYSAFPSLGPGLQHRVPFFPNPFSFGNLVNNSASAWLSGPPLFSKEKNRCSEEIDEGFAEDLMQDLHMKRVDLVNTLNIEVNNSKLSGRRDEQWKPLIKTTRRRNAQSCSFPQKSQCYIYDLQYDEDRVLNSTSLDALNIDSNKKEEEEMLELVMKALDELKEEVSESVEEDKESENVCETFKVSSSSCCDLRWVDSHGAGVPAIIAFSEQSSSQSILYQPQPDTNKEETSASCHFDLLSDPHKSLSRIWERQLYKRRLSGSIGLDGRVIRNSRKGRTVSCSEALEDTSLSLLTKLKESCDDSCLPPLPTSALQVTDLEKLWAKQSPVDKSKRACSFLLRGRCRKEDCEFAHNLRHVTCRFWQAGQCFKGDDCPFLHGHFFLRVPSKNFRRK